MGVPRESSIANLLGDGNGGAVKEDDWARLTTEGEGEVGTLGAIHLDTPSSPSPVRTDQTLREEVKDFLLLR